WWSRRITSPQAAKTHVEAVIERVEAGRDVQYRIVDAESDEASMIGTVALYDIKQREASMGYWLAADRQGMGYATRAAARLLTYAQSVLDLQTIHLHIARGNTDSQRVAQRLEFERVLAYRRKVRDNELPLTPGEEHIIDLWEAHL
ncbi:MAG TPA: GNAT family N-acetyltransferase, partial [Candidatus Saccharimonadales bacterium]